MNGWALFWFLALVVNLWADVEIVRELRELKRKKSSDTPSKGWRADLKKRGSKPKQTMHLDEMPESEAVRHLLKLGYKPEDIGSLELW